MAIVDDERNSFLLVDKPVGFSSFQIVRMLQKKNSKVGHAGTLDPFASGLLILLFDRATKQFDAIQKLDKEYTGEMFLGITADTYDITGSLNEAATNSPIDFGLKALNRVAQQFVGEVQQVPPRFSALKRGGRRLYEISRHNEFVPMKPRRVFIKSFDIELADPPILTFKAVVGKGVYIRSLVHDFGEAIGYGACLLTLRRTRIGKHMVSQARSLGTIARDMAC
jgi:tRNA pseudouridine55 synthase